MSKSLQQWLADGEQVYAQMLEAPTSEPGTIKIMKEATYELDG